MSKSNFSEEFKRDAVHRVTERGYPVAQVSQRLGVSQHSLDDWMKKFAASNAKGNDEAEEIRRLKKPLSTRANEDKRQTDLLLKAWEERSKVYGYRKLHDDLLDQGEACCPNRVARLTRLAGIKAQIGYKRRPGIYRGRSSVAVDNTLDRQFDVTAPDTARVTNITYIRTCEGLAYLAVVIDLYSRRVIGWAM